jgi:general secretion pathway protein C
MTRDNPLDIFFELFQQHSRKLATLTILVLVVLLSLSIANTVLFVVENMDDGSGLAVITSTPEIKVRTKSQIDLSSLNLFGRIEETVAPQVVDAPETKLNLELQGVFISENEKASTAIVAEKNKAGELFRIGDRLPGNAILSAVFDDHILIRRGTRTEKLMFSDSNLLTTANRSNASTGTQQKTQPMTSRLQQVRQRIAQRNQGSRNPAGPSRTPGASLRDYMDKNREEIQQDPQALLADLGMSPISEGNANGYKVSGEVSQVALMQAGLQQNDIILSVNGKAVGDVMNDRTFIAQAMESKRVRVEVQRGSRKFFLTVPIP